MRRFVPYSCNCSAVTSMLLSTRLTHIVMAALVHWRKHSLDMQHGFATQVRARLQSASVQLAPNCLITYTSSGARSTLEPTALHHDTL